MSFEKAIEFILIHEGGSTITEDPFDNGGLTKYGISQRAHPLLNIRALTEDEAKQIYREDYWNKIRGDELPPALAVVVFDSAVNQGPHAAIRMLQQAVGVHDDGILGPKTMEAAKKAGSMILSELVARRMVVYGLNPNFTRYGLGWSRRLAACHELACQGLDNLKEP